MAHETDIILTITAALVAAAVGGYLATRLRLPPIVGFLLAGVAIGPFTPGFTADTSIAGELAQIGVILLMFGVGIHFSISDLLKVASVAAPAALLQVVLFIGVVAGGLVWWGWTPSAAFLTALALLVVSTVIAVNALGTRGELDTLSGRIAVGWLVVEDLVTVLALVLIPVLTDSAGTETGGLVSSLALTLLKVVVLGAVMVVVGARLVPWLLVRVAKVGSRELFSLTVLALALGIAWASAELFDVSLALGAFLAGLVISESDMSHQAAADALPLQDAFAVLFFVSVGMLFDPLGLVENPVLLLVFLGVVLVLKPGLTILYLIARGFPAQVGLTIGASRAQIGEFSFILGSLGLTLGIIDEEVNSLILACAIISITLNPLIFAAVGPAERWLRHGRTGRAMVSRAAEPSLGLVDAPILRGHAVLCGYGRVGQVVAQALQRRGFHYVVIDYNRQVVDTLRDEGVEAWYGDAANPILLRRLNLERARVLVVAVPDPITARLVVEYAERVNERLPIVVRTHSEREWQHFQNNPQVEAVLAELELALEMTRFTLRRFGLGSTETQAILRGLRAGDTQSDQWD
jgi:CPA2 family monovalent cation:H+ antiporter-2